MRFFSKLKSILNSIVKSNSRKFDKYEPISQCIWEFRGCSQTLFIQSDWAWAMFQRMDKSTLSFRMCKAKRLAAEIAAKGVSAKFQFRGLHTKTHHTFQIFFFVQKKKKDLNPQKNQVKKMDGWFFFHFTVMHYFALIYHKKRISSKIL